MTWLPKKRVVVPVDFSDESLAAVELARELVENVSHLHVIHVLPRLHPAEPGVVWETVDDESRRQHAEESLRQNLTDRNVAGAGTFIAFGNPGREIAAYAEKLPADLIVIPSHGRTGLSRILLGSTAERVIRLATCPVLVLRGKPSG